MAISVPYGNIITLLSSCVYVNVRIAKAARLAARGIARRENEREFRPRPYYRKHPKPAKIERVATHSLQNRVFRFDPRRPIYHTLELPWAFYAPFPA